jgi:phospholipid/cholesterol/gamma-HCH transport system substrate-binding protein
MSERRQPVEVYVGLFVILGIILLGWLLSHFGGVASGPRGGYPLFVEVNDATGVRSGVPVSLGGVDIGYVAGEPQLQEDYTGLRIELSIFEGRRIPIGSAVTVGTNGLMGDSFIRVIPPTEYDGRFYQEGERIEAKRTGSINDLAGTAGQTLLRTSEVLEEISLTIKDLNEMFKGLEENFLGSENADHLNAMLSSLRVSSERIEIATENLDPLLRTTEEAMVGVKNAAKNVNSAFNEVQVGVEGFTETLEMVNPVVTELDGTLDDLRATLDSANRLMDKLNHGDGLAAALVNDSELRNDLTSFADKLNRNGVLLYPREKQVAAPLREPWKATPLPPSGFDSKTSPEKKGLFHFLKKKET